MFIKSKLDSKDSHKIPLYTWAPEDHKDIKGVIQLVHGKAEHVERYDAFAHRFVEDGFVVVGHNHRGHGQEALESDRLGHFADHDGWKLLLSDMKCVREHIGKKYKSYPVYCFGHSMGSFVTRSYLIDRSKDFDGVVISGTGRYPSFKGLFASRIVESRRRKRPGVISEEIESLLFKDFNKTLNFNKTPFDWLSRDTNEVDKYSKDPLCGFASTPEFYLDVFTLMRLADNVRKLKENELSCPLFFISGSEDPVGEWGKGFNQVVRRYKSTFGHKISSKLYPGARHELTNELNRDEVYHDVHEWITDLMT